MKLNDAAWEAIQGIETPSSFWDLRSVDHVGHWLRLCSEWSRAGHSGFPPLNPFRMLGWSDADVDTFVEPLALLPQASALRNPNSPEMKESANRYSPAQLRWALVCLREGGVERWQQWSVFVQVQARRTAFRSYLLQSWKQLVYDGSVDSGRAGGLQMQRWGDGEQAAGSSPEQVLLSFDQWNSLIGIQIQTFGAKVRQTDSESGRGAEEGSSSEAHQSVPVRVDAVGETVPESAATGLTV